MSRTESRSKVTIEIVNGQLVTNRPSAFSAAFYLPALPSGESGLSRISHTLPEIEAGSIASLCGRKGGGRHAR